MTAIMAVVEMCPISNVFSDCSYPRRILICAHITLFNLEEREGLGCSWFLVKRKEREMQKLPFVRKGLSVSGLQEACLLLVGTTLTSSSKLVREKYLEQQR